MKKKRSSSGSAREEVLGEEGPPAKRTKRKDEFEKLLSLLEEKDSLIAGLTCFLKGAVQCSASSPDEDAVCDGDVVSRYLGVHPRCDHLTRPLEWDRDKRTLDVLLLCFKCLEQVLLFTSAPPTTAMPTSVQLYHTIGHRLVQRLLADHMRCIYHSLLSTQPVKLVQSCLRLLTAMVVQGLDSAKHVQLVFNFGYKPLQVFFSRTTPISDSHSGIVESVRQSMMKFALSFLIVGDTSVISAILQLKGFLSSFFKLLLKDDVLTISLFLITLQDKVVCNSELSKKPKSLFFNQFALKQMASLLSFQPANSDEELAEHVRDVSRQMLMTLCTDMELGICYKAKNVPRGLERTNNPVLLHFLLYLSGRLSNPTSRDIIFGALSSCPDLFISYVQALGMNFEPQPTTKWVTDMKFIVKVYEEFLAVPPMLSGGKTDGSAEQQPPADLVGVAVDLTTPLPVTRAHLSLGLQHPLPLVKYHTLGLIGVVLRRACAVVDQWGPLYRSWKTMSSFLVKYCDSVLKRLPDARTLISLRQRLLQRREDEEGGVRESENDGTSDLCPEERIKNADVAQGTSLSSMVLEVLCGLQRLSPDLFQQVQFRPAKLLPSFPATGVAEEVCWALQININAFEGSLLQNKDAVLSVVWLTLSSDVKISQLSGALLEKVLNGAHPMLFPDAAVLVTALRDATSGHPDLAEGFAKMVANATVSATTTAQRCKLREEVTRVLGGDHGGSHHVSFQDVLDQPACDQGLEMRAGGNKEAFKKDGNGDLMVFISCIFAEFLRCEDAALLPFLNHLLSRLLLISDASTARQLTALTHHHLPNTKLQFTLKPLAPLLDPEAQQILFVAEEKEEECPARFEGLGLQLEVPFILRALLFAMWRLVTTPEAPVFRAPEMAHRIQVLTDLLTSVSPRLRLEEGIMAEKLKGVARQLSTLLREIVNTHGDQEGVFMDLAVKLITELHPWCSRELFALVEELIRRGWESLDFEVPVRILREILRTPVQAKATMFEGSKRRSGGPGRVPGSRLDDSSLVRLLELVSHRHSCAELVEVAFELLKDRVTNSGLAINSSSSGCGQVEATSNPFRSLDPRTAMLACLETAGKSRDVPADQKPLLVIGKDCAFRLLERCIKTADLHAVLLLCGCSREIAVHFEASHLRKICRSARRGELVALRIVEGYLKVGPTGDGVCVVKKLLLKHCARMLGSEDSQSEVGSILQSLASLSSVAPEELTKHCKEWLSQSATVSRFDKGDHQLFACDEDEKEAVVGLLVTMVELHPSFCKSSHIPTLLGAYSATQSKSDRGLLYLMAKYEENKVPSGVCSPFLWGEAALEQHTLRKGMYDRPPDISDVLKLLDTHTLLKTTSAFSPHLELEPSNPFLEQLSHQHESKDCSRGKENSRLYDPCFLLPLLSHYLEPGAHMDCRSFVGHGCLGLLIVALSSLHEEVRVAAGHALSRFEVHLEESKFREKPQVAALVEILKNSVLEDFPRLPSVWTSVAAKASLLFLRADGAVYPVVSHFTIHKPAFPLREVPLLLLMLHSSSAEHGAEEQLWLLKVLVDGLKCKEDIRLYEKHKVFSHVAALAGSAMLEPRAKELAKDLLRSAIKVNQDHIIRTTA